MAPERQVMEKGRAFVADRLGALLARRATGPEAALLATFTQALLARGPGYLATLPEEEAAALVRSAFRFYAAAGPEIRVRALTPTYVTEGWDAPVSVIETCMPDRPFIVDTIREELRAGGVEIRALLHPILAARRDPTGRLEALAPPSGGERRESFAHVAIPRTTDGARLAAFAAAVRERLEDVCLVTDDFPLMVARAQAAADECERLGRGRAAPAALEASAVADFLRWLVDGAFVFLGYREYELAAPDGAATVQLRPGSGLGLLRREGRSAFTRPRRVAELPAPARARVTGPRILTIGKTAAEAPVHRRARMDDIGVKVFDAEGRVAGERRFIGLFTSKAYAEESAEIPLLRRTLRQILAAEQVVPGSHDFKEIVAIFNSLPKGELFAGSVADLRADIRTIIAAARSDDVVVSIGPRAEGERVSALVIMPRERFTEAARERILELLAARLGGALLEDHVHIGEDDRVRLHFAFTPGPEPLAADRIEALREAIGALLRTWEERLSDALAERHGPEGARLAVRYAHGFPRHYQAAVAVERAVEDVTLLAAAAADGAPRATLVNEPGTPDATVLRLYFAGAPAVLADLLPVLAHLGLRPLAEDQVAVIPADGPAGFVQTFVVQDRHGRPLDAEAVRGRLVDALLAVWAGRVENDVLGRLVLEAGLEWRAVEALRTYAAYGVQVGLGPRAAVEAVLADHPAPAGHLFACFAARFRPGGVEGNPRERFLASLDGVQSLRQDQCLRALLQAVEATVRTTFYVEPAREVVTIKIRSADLGYLPIPRPLYEIFVHGPTVEGIHLRAGKVARGGIRAADRPEDLRTEVLGLMRTQTLKNALIVATGAKGGFVVKGPPGRVTVEAAYATFIRALLDVTDNLVEGRIVHPRGLLVHDEEDPYLVVAADKGTAAFSDLANQVAAEYGFWLSDAFASGGSHGYDHKALGITARGTWECVRTHSHELGVDADTAPLTVIGIGDMSGDVFGNGLLRSPQLRLVAAFNHLHVFLDPDPDPARSFAERERLYRAGKGWDGYDARVLSAGGMVVPRTAKRVALSPEVRARLGVREEGLSGEALVRAVLAAEAELLFHGGIGTYVKATGETHAEVRDAANDAVRVDASALRTKVVAEGGNLGFTQRARVEYALAGGRINTDAVDNSAGVDMSDHEVNLKMGMQPAVASGALDMAARNALLEAVREEVVGQVLAHNRRQSRLLTVDQVRSRTRLADFRELLAELERTVGLERPLMALPEGAALRARRGEFLGLTRPELAVLMAHVKIQLQADLLAAGVPDDPLFEPYLLAYFPASVAERFPEAVRGHRLRREIIAAEVANALVDHVGITFVHRLARDSGAVAAEVVRAWGIAWPLAGGPALAHEIGAQQLAADVEVACALALEGTAARVTKWVLANTDPARSAAAVATDLEAALAPVRPRLAEWVAGGEAEAFHKRATEFEIAGLPAPLARALATAEWLTGALDVVTVARQLGLDAEVAGRRYYALGQHVDFAWILARLVEAGEEDRWQRRAVEGLVADLLQARRRLTGVGGEALPARPLAAVQELVRDLRAAPRVTLVALQVVVYEIRRLAEQEGAGERTWR